MQLGCRKSYFTEPLPHAWNISQESTNRNHHKTKRDTPKLRGWRCSHCKVIKVLCSNFQRSCGRLWRVVRSKFQRSSCKRILNKAMLPTINLLGDRCGNLTRCRVKKYVMFEFYLQLIYSNCERNSHLDQTSLAAVWTFSRRGWTFKDDIFRSINAHFIALIHDKFVSKWIDLQEGPWKTATNEAAKPLGNMSFVA